MGCIHGVNRHEAILFPERLDDAMAAEHLVRFIDAFVDHLNLTTLGCQRATPAATGRPAYHPADLLKLYMYGSLLLDSGVFGSNVVREGQCFFKTIEKEGLQGGKGDEHEVGQPQHLHDPGIQQEPNAFR